MAMTRFDGMVNYSNPMISSIDTGLDMNFAGDNDEIYVN